MRVVHITEAMVHATVPLVDAMIRKDCEAAGVTVPLPFGSVHTDYDKAFKAISPATRLWIETVGECGYRLQLEKSHGMLFTRPV